MCLCIEGCTCVIEYDIILTGRLSKTWGMDEIPAWVHQAAAHRKLNLNWLLDELIRGMSLCQGTNLRNELFCFPGLQQVKKGMVGGS